MNLSTIRVWLRASTQVVLAGLLVTVGTGGLKAQTTKGGLVGTVVDATGAVVPNAAVTVTSEGTNLSRDQQTGDSGTFAFNLLDPGNYTVTAAASGFKKTSVSGIQVAAGADTKNTVTLQPGGASDTVTVNASDEAQLQTDSGTVQSTVSNKSVQDLPLNGRNFIDLVQLQPGVTPGDQNNVQAGGFPDDRRQSSSVSANGQSQEFNNEQIDGLDNNEREQGLIAVRPSLDAIGEIRVVTSNFPAETGRTGGAVVNVITKAGTNSFHGTVFEYLRNDALDTRNYFAKAGVTPKPEYRLNQFGASIGGPIVREKTYFFASYEGFRQVQGRTAVSTVPTLYEQNHPGDFTDVGGPLVANPNSIALMYFGMYPHPNATGTMVNGIPVNNFVYEPKNILNYNTYDGQLDHHFNANNQLFVHYSFNPVTADIPGALPPATVGSSVVQNVGAGSFAQSFEEISGPSTIGSQGILGSYLHIFTPNLLMELRGGYTRVSLKANTLNYGKNLSDEFGIVGGNLGTSGSSGLSSILFFNGPYASLGDSFFVPLYDTNNVFQENGDVSYSHGKHNLKAGASLIRRQLNYLQDPFSPQGGFAYFGITGNAEADFLSGLNVFSYRGNELVSPGYRTWETSTFVQDNYQPMPQLTLNLGLRWEIITPFTEAHNNYSNFNPVTGQVDVAGIGTSSSLGVPISYKDVSPRLGFAYSLPRNAVIRGGYSIGFYPVLYAVPIQNPNPPTTFLCFPCANSFASFPNLPSPSAPSTTNPSGSLYYRAPDSSLGYSHMFNLTFEKQYGPLAFSAAYVGGVWVHQGGGGNFNLPVPSGTLKTPAYVYATTDPDVTSISLVNNSGHGSYNALQLSANQRTTKGLSFFANYTLAHGLSDGSQIGANVASGLLYRTPNYDYGNTQIDVRNRFAMGLNYAIPGGQDLRGTARFLVTGWQTNLIAYYQTGLPFTVTNGTLLSNGNVPINLPGVTSDRPNVLRSAKLSNRGVNQWFDTSYCANTISGQATHDTNCAFQGQNVGTAGNEEVNQLDSPPDREVDLSLFKTIPIREQINVTFRAECFNIANTPNFNTPNDVLGNPGVGQITSTLPNSAQREFQFALKLAF